MWAPARFFQQTGSLLKLVVRAALGFDSAGSRPSRRPSILLAGVTHVMTRFTAESVV
jgi:hypothetical protein